MHRQKTYKTEKSRRLTALPYKQAVTYYQNRGRRWYVRCFLFLVAVTIGGLVYLFCYSPIFGLQTVNVQGNRNIAIEEINKLVNTQKANSRFFVFFQNNLIFFNIKQLEQSLHERYKLENLKIAKNPPHELNIILEERTALFALRKENKQYNMDKHGVILSEKTLWEPLPENIDENKDEKTAGDVPKEENTIGRIQELYPADGLIAIYDQTDGAPSLSVETIQNILSISQTLPIKINKDIDCFIIPDNTFRLDVRTEEGWKIYFNQSDDIAKQIERLAVLMEKEIGDASKLEYVDLRFEKNVYYK